MAQDQSQSSHSGPAIRRPISEESWIEVSSRPSSSSLSSAATDEVVTTGLRVSQDASQRRRRRLIRSATTQMQGRIPLPRGAGNSQAEYEESEADSDRVMSSSNEELQPRFLTEESNDESPSIPKSSSSDGDSLQDDEDEIATALGPVDGSPIFTPQPNAFSHPPSGRLSQRESESYFPPLPSSHASSARQSVSGPGPATIRQVPRARSHTPYNMIAPSASVDHDAALRASLSTLLSCAAAARGLQKREPQSTIETSRSIVPPRNRNSGRVNQNTLRIVPESALSRIEEQSRPASHTSDSPASPGSLPSKRKSKSPVRERRKRNRSAYGIHNQDIMGVSPTLTTWVVGAGVLVLFSAISFTAGYTLGKEVGRVDAMGSGNGLGCGAELESEIGRGLARRSGWRWSNASSVRV